MASDHPMDALLAAARGALLPLESTLAAAARDLNSHLLRPETASLGAAPPEAATKASTSSVRLPFKSLLLEPFGSKQKPPAKDAASHANCLHFAAAWSVLVSNFVQGLQKPLKSVKKCFGKPPPQKQEPQKAPFWGKRSVNSDAPPLELLLCIAVDSLVHNFQMLDMVCKETSVKFCNKAPSEAAQFDHFEAIKKLINGKKADFDGFLSNMGFARVGAPLASIVGTSPSSSPAVSEVGSEGGEREEAENRLPQKLASGLLNIPLSNVERLRSTLSAVSLNELIEFIPQLVGKPSADHPDKKKLFSVQDFFRYAEAEGKRFFEELDRDGDGQVTLEDLEIAMRKRRLPRRYARDFLRRTRSNLFSKSIGWKQFLSLMEQKEPTILRAYTTLCLSKSGTIHKNQIMTSLKSAGLPANEDNAAAMMRYLNADSEGSISYSHFRNFMLLLPSERLEDDPRSIWFEAATVVAVPPPVEISTESVLKSALAGGLACALSTSVMHPIDSMKTRVQASTLSFPELISKLPQIGLRGLYRGSVPAILGQFSSHGLRTGIYEASKLVLISVAPTLPEIQVQSLASFCSTILGTAVRIPCEVLKQRLQAGIFDNVGEAIVGTMRQDGPKGFFRGTGATLCREVPFYVAGMCLYAEAKKGAQNVLNRDLEPWETVAVGALSGGLAAVVTTPFDVMKTRMMTAPQGMPVSMQMLAFSILRKEGPLGLFKGAIPRFFWIAPLGAMNFAGYELAKKAMIQSENEAGDQMPEKKMVGPGGG